MLKKILFYILVISFFFFSGFVVFAKNVEIHGFNFPETKVIEGRLLKLNGVSTFKKFSFIKVYVVGLYLESLSRDSVEIINSDQIKYMHTIYLTDKATKEKIKEGFIHLITKHNPQEYIDIQEISTFPKKNVNKKK